MKIIATAVHGEFNPCEEEGWSLASFNARHLSFKHPSKYCDDDGVLFVDSESDDYQTQKLNDLYEDGLLFVLSYFEHGNCVWSLRGEGPQCRWDGTRTAGLLWAPTDIPEDGREEAARNFLRRYTEWCNGEVYNLDLVNDDGSESSIDTVGGVFGSDVDSAAVEYFGQDASLVIPVEYR